MKLKIKVVPSAKHNRLVEENETYKVYLTAPPVEGKANEALVEFLAEHFKVKRRQIKIVSGLKSRQKVVEIN